MFNIKDFNSFLRVPRVPSNIRLLIKTTWGFYEWGGLVIGGSDYSVLLEVSQIRYRCRVVPYGISRFCATSDKTGRVKTRSLLHSFCTLLVYVAETICESPRKRSSAEQINLRYHLCIVLQHSVVQRVEGFMTEPWVTTESGPRLPSINWSTQTCGLHLSPQTDYNLFGIYI